MNQALRQKLAATPRLDGETDAAYDARVAGLCAADPRTVSPIPLADLRPLLTALGILGKLARAAQADDTAANAYAYLNSANLTIRSDLDGPAPADYAAQLDAMMTGLAALGLTDDVKARVIALGGGYAVRTATAADVTAERTAMATEAAAAAALAAGETWHALQADVWNAMDADYDAWKSAVAGGQVDAPLPKGVVREA